MGAARASHTVLLAGLQLTPQQGMSMQGRSLAGAPPFARCRAMLRLPADPGAHAAQPVVFCAVPAACVPHQPVVRA